MPLNFQIGNADEPRGHALAYFRVSTEPEQLYVTYLVVLPVIPDLSEFMPPFMAALGAEQFNDFRCFAMPPAPQGMNLEIDDLTRLAELRGDDLLYGGEMFSYDTVRSMDTVGNMLLEYQSRYEERHQRLKAGAPAGSGIAGSGAAGYGASGSGTPGAGRQLTEPERSPPDDSLAVDNVLWELMSNSSRLEEMSKMIDSLRVAQAGNDDALVRATLSKMRELGRLLPPEYKATAMITAASNPYQNRLAQLYMDRSYRLLEGKYSDVRRMDGEIQELMENWN